MDALIEAVPADLLDATFGLFREELLLADPDYAARIGLAALDADSFSHAYFAGRAGHDPFAWAALNLAEAQNKFQQQVVVPWRYAILRMHEVVARVVPHLSAEDLKQFHRGLKAVFVDDYATVPHESIKRLLALRRAGKVEALGLGADYRVTSPDDAPGADLVWAGGTHHFSAFVEATGQTTLDLENLPFPTLLAQGAVRLARAGRTFWSEEDGTVETGGVDVDDTFRPVNDLDLHEGLHLLALPFLLHLRPFHQGLTSAEELGQVAARAILTELSPIEDNPRLVGTERSKLYPFHPGNYDPRADFENSRV